MARLVGLVALLLAVVLAFASPAAAWWCPGHMLTALVAQKSLTPQVMAQVSPLIQYLAEDYPESPDFVTAACWADDLKSLGVEEMSNWHYINLPYVKSFLFDATPAVSNVSNVAWALTESNSTVSDWKVKKIDKARFLRFVLHFAGDIHQPLHAATQYDQNRFPVPKGDEGGNFYKIQGANQSELHAFFDSGAGLWQNSIQRPLRPNATAWLDGWASKIMAAYPQASFKTELALQDPYQWAEGTYKLAVDVAYSTPYDAPLSADFIATARKVCQSQVALGGYRLAHMLNVLFGSTSKLRVV